jgi:hypothetical protein
MDTLDGELERKRAELVAQLRRLGDHLRERADTLEQLPLEQACEALVLFAEPVTQIMQTIRKL